MIGPVEEKLMDTILEHEDSDEILLELMLRFAKKSWQHSRALLNTVPKIVDTAYLGMAKQVQEQSEAVFSLMCQQHVKFTGKSELFASMVPVCKARFPKGNADGKSVVEKDYFRKFLKLLKDPKAFSWEKDARWAEVEGYTDYLRLVERQIPREEES